MPLCFRGDEYGPDDQWDPGPTDSWWSEIRGERKMSDVEQLRALWKSADQTARDDTLPAYIRERAEDLAETLQGVFAAAAATTNPPAAEVAQPPPPAAPLPLTAVPDGQHYNVTARDEKGAAAARTV